MTTTMAVRPTEAGVPDAAPGFDGTTIRVGALTNTGAPLAAIGVPLTEGNKAYFAHINSEGGVAGKYPIELVQEDTSYSRDIAPQKFTATVDNVVMYVQALGTADRRRVAPEPRGRERHRGAGVARLEVGAGAEPAPGGRSVPDPGHQRDRLVLLPVRQRGRRALRAGIGRRVRRRRPGGRRLRRRRARHRGGFDAALRRARRSGGHTGLRSHRERARGVRLRRGVPDRHVGRHPGDRDGVRRSARSGLLADRDRSVADLGHRLRSDPVHPEQLPPGLRGNRVRRHLGAGDGAARQDQGPVRRRAEARHLLQLRLPAGGGHRGPAREGGRARRPLA